MSETLAAAPVSAPETSPDQEGGDGSAEAAQVIDALENSLTIGGEQPATTASEPEAEVPHTPEEESAEIQLTGLRSRLIGFQDRFVTSNIQRIGGVADGVKDQFDKDKKAVFMLERRQNAKDKAIARLELRRARTNPRSMRYRHLDKKIGKLYRKSNAIHGKIARLDGAAVEREAFRKQANEARKEELRLKRHELQIAKGVAAERKRRRQVQKERWSTGNKAKREELATKIRSWDSIHIFERKLREKITGKATGGGHH